MRFVSFLFSLLASVGVIALTYFYAVEQIDYLVYMAAVTAAGIFLAFVAGHFIYRSSFQKRQAKQAKQKLEEAQLQVHELEALRLQHETDLNHYRQSTMNVRPVVEDISDAQNASDQTTIIHPPQR